MKALQSFAHPVGGPALLIIDYEELLATVNDDEVAVRLVRRGTEERREIQKTCAVLVHRVRPRECPLDRLPVESPYLVSREGALAVESDAGDRDEGPGLKLLTFELDSVRALQCLARTLARTRPFVRLRLSGRYQTHWAGSKEASY